MAELGGERRRVALGPSVDALEGRVLLSRGAGRLPREAPAVVELEGARRGRGDWARRGVEVGSELGAATHHRFGPRVGRGLGGATAARWSWLAGTYWCVPPANLPAILYSPSDQTILPQMDQTVFQITGYRNGYFWGVVVTQLGSLEPTTSSLIGSVTPEGRVLLNFTQMEDSSGPAITQGIGRMRVKHGRWTMENQMFTSPSDEIQVGHWAYMVRTRPGMPSWNSLPGVGVSVPEFLGDSAGEGPEPV